MSNRYIIIFKIENSNIKFVILKVQESNRHKSQSFGTKFGFSSFFYPGTFKMIIMSLYFQLLFILVNTPLKFRF